MAEWNARCLGELAGVRARIGWRGLAASEYTSEGPYLIAAQHIRGGRVDWFSCDHVSDARYRESWEIALQQGDVIVSKDGTIGRVARIDALPGPATINGTMMLVRPGNTLDHRFLYHSLMGRTFKKLIDDKVSGSSVPHLFQRDMVTLPIQLPPLPEQRQIAEILDAVDEAIRKTEEIIAKLTQVKQGLLHDLLTRGIDDNGELRDPDRHPEQFKASPLGRIPKGWDVGSVGTHCGIHNTLRKPISVEERDRMRGTYPYYGPTGVLDYICEFRVEGTYVLIGEDGDHFLKFDHWPMTQLVTGRFNVNNHAHILSGERCRVDWIDTWFRHRDITLHLTRQGAGRFKLNKASLKAVPMALPSEPEQREIRRRLDGLEERLESERYQATKLGLLKNGLMEDLLTGRVRVTKLLEDAAE